MAELTDTIETSLTRFLIYLLLGLIAWMALTVFMSLGAELARRIVDIPLLDWIQGNLIPLSLGLTIAGYGWIRLAKLSDARG